MPGIVGVAGTDPTGRGVVVSRFVWARAVDPAPREMIRMQERGTPARVEAVLFPTGTHLLEAGLLQRAGPGHPQSIGESIPLQRPNGRSRCGRSPAGPAIEAVLRGRNQSGSVTAMARHRHLCVGAAHFI
jgi:hypothetical protein